MYCLHLLFDKSMGFSPNASLKAWRDPLTPLKRCNVEPNSYLNMRRVNLLQGNGFKNICSNTILMVTIHRNLFRLFSAINDMKGATSALMGNFKHKRLLQIFRTLVWVHLELIEGLQFTLQVFTLRCKIFSLRGFLSSKKRVWSRLQNAQLFRLRVTVWNFSEMPVWRTSEL